MKPFLSIIIPAYNEEKRIAATLIDIDYHLALKDYSYEIIVISDGSTDATVSIVKRFSHLIKNLYLIENKENHGKGFVVRQAMLYAKGQWRLFTDADNSTSIDQFEKMLPYFKEGFEIVIGSRAIKGAKLMPAQPLIRRVLGRLSNLLIQILLLPGIKDTQCGFKCFSDKAAKKIFSLAKIDRWGFDIEALALAKKMGYKIKEIPVVWKNDLRSTVSASAYFSTLYDLWKIFWSLKKGKYPL